MDPRLQQAAESGNIKELYAIIHKNPFILDNIDAVPFVCTPLHVAATFGNIHFAVELMHLKPSFARKLDTDGCSPLHLAVTNGQIEFVSWMLWIYHDLASVKGRNGITPFLLLVLYGHTHVVSECLLNYPDCIKDVNVNQQNALHIAVKNNKIEALQVLMEWIQRMSQKDAAGIESLVMNKIDVKYNRPLHIAAKTNNQQALKMLLGCNSVDRNKQNGDGVTFLDILKNKEQSADDGELDLEKDIVKTGCKEVASVPKSKCLSDSTKSSITFKTYCSTQMRRLRSNTSDEARGVFLIVCALIITSTYQTALQPPGGIHQSEDANAGSVVMNLTFFIFLWLSNTIGFCCAIFYTFCLIPIGSLFETWYFWIGLSLCLSYALAMAVISPHPLVFLFATFLFFLLFALYLLFDLFTRHRRKPEA